MLKRILLVDDDDLDVELMYAALDAHHLANRIDRVRDGAEALDYLHCRNGHSGRTSGIPLVVFLDLKMPRLGGIEFLQAIQGQEAFSHLPIVVITSSQEEQDLDRCYTLGVNSYVVKPVDFEQFSEAVAKLGFYWAVLNEPAPEP